MSDKISTEVDYGSIKSSTYGILFFGVPLHAEHRFNSLAAVSLDEQDDPNESALMKTLKRDLRWLQKSNSEYSQISSDFVTKYFTESAGDVAVAHSQVHMSLLKLLKVNKFFLVNFK